MYRVSAPGIRWRLEQRVGKVYRSSGQVRVCVGSLERSSRRQDLGSCILFVCVILFYSATYCTYISSLQQRFFAGANGRPDRVDAGRTCLPVAGGDTVVSASMCIYLVSSPARKYFPFQGEARPFLLKTFCLLDGAPSMEPVAFLIQVARQFSDWRVILDILVFTLIIYLLYRTLRATGTWQIVLGLTIAAIGAGLASLIGLRGVEWLFSNFSQVALIALLVIFQPEMRKVLERTTSLLRGQSREESVSLATLVGDVLFALSKRRWGGLIVIPGRDSLKQWISEGIEVDAVPSFSLLMSIFDPSSPGHDGAVIIASGRIKRIAVRLPLSETNSLPEIMGTRHHASMGLAEKTDALVLTVSEERGTISFFERGNRVTVSDQADAVARILEHGMSSVMKAADSAAVKGRIWRTATEAGTCFLVACLFWVTVVMTKTQVGDMIFTVPVQYSGLQSHLVLEGEVPEDVKLHLGGPMSTLTTLDLSLLKVQVDLSGVGEGEQVVTLNEQNVQVGKKVKVLDIIPSSFDLLVKTLQKKMLPVEPQFIGQLPEGMKILSVEVVPDTVQVFMPDDATKKGSSAQVLRTTPIYLNGLQADTTVYCKIIAPSFVQQDRRWPDIEVRIKVGPGGRKSKAGPPDA